MHLVKAVIGYLLGFIALALFAYLAFNRGAPTDATWRFAFMVSGAVAVAELLVLQYAIAKPTNRLLIAANIYLVLGGLAFALNQEWFLRFYERLGLSAILVLMFVVGAVFTLISKAGFVGATGNTVRTRQASYVLLALVGGALVVAQHYPAIYKGVSVALITALALSNRVLRTWASK